MGQRFARRGILAGLIILLSAQWQLAAQVNSYSATKGKLFVQNSGERPVEGENFKYALRAVVEGRGISAVEGTAPTGFPLAFNQTQNGFISYRPLDTIENLESFFGSGNYLLNITSEAGEREVQLPVGMAGFPEPAPFITNFTEGQSINPEEDFILKWEGFPNATENNFVELEVYVGGIRVYSLTTTNAQAEIAAGTLGTNRVYEGRLRFMKAIVRDRSSYPGAIGIGGFYSETEFAIATGQGTLPPRWKEPKKKEDGMIEFVLEGEEGRRFIIESGENLGAWEGLETNVVQQGAIRFSMAPTGSQKFFRAKTR